jgi:chemotaxis protein methyltransferase CheR
VATDVDAQLLERARAARYAPSSAKDLPPSWREALFEACDGTLVLRDRFRAAVRFERQDLRREAPDGSFDLVLCRNVAFTYFAPPGQRDALARIGARLRPGGALVIGRHEALTDDTVRFLPWEHAPSVFRRDPEAAAP